MWAWKEVLDFAKRSKLMKYKRIIKLYVWVDVYLLHLCNVYIRGVDTSLKHEAINSG